MSRSRKTLQSVELVDPQLQHLDWSICAALVALLAFLPAALGTHRAWNEAIALWLTIGTLFLLGLKLIARPDQRFVWSWTYLPIGLLLAFIGFQLIPLPTELLKLLSPATLTDRLKLLSDLPAGLRREHFALSFYPHNTWHDLRNLLATVGIFVATVNVSRNASTIKLLLWSIAIIATAEAILAVAQDLSGATEIYWAFPTIREGPDGGTFPNHNFFSQFINLSSGATLGLLLLTIDKTFHRHDYTPAEMIEKFTSAAFRPAYFLVAMLSINAGAVFLSLSRGGILSIVIAASFTAVLLIIRGGRRGMGVAGWFAGLAVVFVFVLIIAGGAELVEARLKKVGNRDDQYDRYRLTTDTLNMWRRYPLAGVGFGTYEFVFPRFDTAHVEVTATHAEDEYVELLAELGLIGSACIVSFGAMVGMAFFRARDRGKKTTEERNSRTVQRTVELAKPPDHQRSSAHRRRPGTSISSSLSIGIGFGLMAMLVQSLTDFAPHFLSVSMPAAVLCGIMINLAYLRQQERNNLPPEQTTPAPTAMNRRRLIRGAVLATVLFLSLGLLIQAMHAWSAENDWDRVDASEKIVSTAGWKNVDGEATNMNRYATAAIEADPLNVFRHFWRAVYQSYTLDLSLSKADRQRAIESLNDDLQAARSQCPTFGPMLCQIGQWQQNELNQWKDGAEAIRLGVWLAPNDSTANFVAGGLYADEGHWDDAIGAFKTAISLQHAIISDIMDVVLDQYHRPDSLLLLAQTNIPDLRLAADKLRQRDAPTATPTADSAATAPSTAPSTRPVSQNELFAREADRLIDLEIEREADQPDASAAQLEEMAMLDVRRKQSAPALPYFEKSLLLNYGNEPLRVAYAKALMATQNEDEALRQLRIAQRMAPSDSESHKLSEQILVHRAMSDPALRGPATLPGQ